MRRADVRARGLRLPEVLDGREFRLFFGAQLLSALGDGVVLVAIGFAVLDATGSVVSLGKVMAARFIPMAVLLLVGGVLADRFPRRALMIGSCLVRSSAQATMATLLVTGHAQLSSCLIVQGAYGCAEAFFRPAAMGLMPQIVRSEHLPQANSLDEMTFAMSRIVGPAFGGLLVIGWGSAGAIATDAIAVAIAAVLISRLRPAPNASVDGTGETADRTDGGESFVKQLTAGLVEVKRRPWITLATLNWALFGALTIPAVLVLGPELAWRNLGGVPGWTALTVAFGAGALAGSVAAIGLDVRRPGFVLVAMLAFATLRPAFFVSGASLPVIAGLCFLCGAAASIASCVWSLLLQRNVPRAALSRVSAVGEFGSSALMPVGYVIASPVALHLGFDRGVLLLGLVPVIVCIATLGFGAMRQLRWESGPVAPTAADAIAA